MRVLLAVLLVGLVGCGGEDNSPGDVAAPSSPAVTPVKAENAEADGPKPKADQPPAQAAGGGSVPTPEDSQAKVDKSPVHTAAEQKAAAKKSVEGRKTHTLKGHSGPVSRVSFSPDGKRIVSGSRDSTVMVWDISSLDTSK